MTRDTQPITPRVDPEAMREAARAVLTRGLGQFVAAAAAKQIDDLASLYPPGDGFRQGFLDHIRRYGPSAAAGPLGPVTLREGRAEALVTISFRWRANFGVERSGAARFLVSARDNGAAGWLFSGVRLMEAFP